MPKSSLTLLSNEEVEPVMNKPKKTLLLQGNVSKRGELVFTRSMLTALALTPDQPVRFGRLIIKGTPVLFLIILEQIDEASSRFIRVGPSYGLRLHGQLNTLLPDYKERPYRFILEPEPIDGYNSFRIQFMEGRLHL